jgi:hypothetical protein
MRITEARRRSLLARRIAMNLTMWTNPITGARLERDELARLRAQAHRLYEANTHIFEDELDAMSALANVPSPVAAA